MDATIVHFFSALVRYITIAFTAVAAFGRVGIETSSIIAVIGAAGLAIGLALQGSLSTLPQAYCLSPASFPRREIVQIGLVIGTVEKVHISPPLCSLRIAKKLSSNGKIIADNIINYSRHPYRRIDLIIGVDYQSRIADVKNVIHRIIEQDHRIDKTRDITVRLGELAPSSLNFYVRVWCPTLSTGVLTTIFWKYQRKQWMKTASIFLTPDGCPG